MSNIKAKQVEGALDMSSTQDVSGVKRCSAPVTVLGTSAYHMVLSNGCIYFVQNASVLEQEGNSRLWVAGGTVKSEVYMRGQWQSVV